MGLTHPQFSKGLRRTYLFFNAKVRKVNRRGTQSNPWRTSA